MIPLFSYAALGSTLSWAIAAADDSLSREKAKELIQQSLSDKDVEVTINLRRYNETLFSELGKNGYLLLPPLGEERRPSQLTEKIAPYVVKNYQGFPGEVRLKLGKLVVLAVTGITKPSDAFGQTIATVEYTAMGDLNELGVLFRSYGPDKSIDDPWKGSKTFVLYDDGWRLAK